MRRRLLRLPTCRCYARKVYERSDDGRSVRCRGAGPEPACGLDCCGLLSCIGGCLGLAWPPAGTHRCRGGVRGAILDGRDADVGEHHGFGGEARDPCLQGVILTRAYCSCQRLFWRTMSSIAPVTRSTWP